MNLTLNGATEIASKVNFDFEKANKIQFRSTVESRILIKGQNKITL